MRRAVSLLLILFFGLGPLTATLQAQDDSRLPACCRRNGAHHCAMSDAMIAAMVRALAGKPVIGAPAHCPCYPGHNHATVASFYALAPRKSDLPALLQELHNSVFAGNTPRLVPTRTHSGRGPPTWLIA